MKKNKKTPKINTVSDEEMHGFIKGLFTTTEPHLDTSLDFHVPTLESMQDQDVEIASMTEVNEFISGLFKKE